MWDQVRAVLFNPERNTNVRKATRYLLTCLIHRGDCGAAMFSGPRDCCTKQGLITLMIQRGVEVMPGGPAVPPVRRVSGANRGFAGDEGRFRQRGRS